MQNRHFHICAFLISRFFSDFIFRCETMPWIFYAIGAVLPTTYFISLMRAILLRSTAFLAYLRALVILLAMSVLLFCICALRFRDANEISRLRPPSASQRRGYTAAGSKNVSAMAGILLVQLSQSL
jgi:hypothetical protein